jgi:hypothetical protein
MTRGTCCLLATALLVGTAGCRKKETAGPPPGRGLPADPAAWVRFRPPIGDVSVLFPGEPRERTGFGTIDPKRQFVYEIGPRRALLVAVGVLDGEPPTDVNKKLLTEERDLGVKHSRGQLASERSFDRDGVAVLEVLIRKPDGAMTRALLFIKGRYSYMLAALGTEDEVKDADSDRFLNSCSFDR